MPGNVLTRNGRLSAVIDFGAAGLGDPSQDLIVAWMLLPAHVRPAFRRATGVDGATWLRGRARALSMAAGHLPYYQDTNPVMADNARTPSAKSSPTTRHLVDETPICALRSRRRRSPRSHCSAAHPVHARTSTEAAAHQCGGRSLSSGRLGHVIDSRPQRSAGAAPPARRRRARRRWGTAG